MTNPNALTKIAAQLGDCAQRYPGRVFRRDLRSGARVSYLVQAGRITVAVARPNVPVGETEITTFRRDLGIPAHATRVPAAGQQERRDGTTTWHQLGWYWMDTIKDDRHDDTTD